ncbi:MAG: hypothetical protein ACKVUS_08610, partial [Saprospiraceae bacterium]
MKKTTLARAIAQGFLTAFILAHSSFIIAQNAPSHSLTFSPAHPLTLPPPPDEWHIVADNVDPAKYYGITVANGMIGLVSSPEPMKVKDVVLNGAYDNYGRGRVSNIL